MSILAPPEPKLDYVVHGDMRTARVSVKPTRHHEVFELFIVDAGMRCYVAENHMGANWVFRHRFFSRCVENAKRRARAHVKAELRAMKYKKTLNG